MLRTNKAEFLPHAVFLTFAVGAEITCPVSVYAITFLITILTLALRFGSDSSLYFKLERISIFLFFIHMYSLEFLFTYLFHTVLLSVWKSIVFFCGTLG